MTKWIKNVMSSLINSPLVLLQDDDSVVCTLWYGTVKMATCPHCLSKGKINVSIGFYQDKCHECKTNMKPIMMNKERKVVYGEI